MKCKAEKPKKRRTGKISFIFSVFLCFGFLNFCCIVYAQDADLEFNIDSSSNNTAVLPKIFKPGIDLSGRGQHKVKNWPQSLSAPEVLDVWQKDIGFSGVYRIQYDLWEISENARSLEGQKELLSNYENIVKKISDAGGTVILDIFGTPAGLGKVLDKKSPSLDLNAFKELVKKHVWELSCNKKYNVWYEVWSAPDLDEFFLGRKDEYLLLYQAVATGIKELEAENKIHIPVGGPAVSWWFQNCGKNSIVTPEKSLIYELIKYCYNYQLPLDFITWHTYSTDPKAEYEITGYNKTSVALIRDWLVYFKFDKNTPLIVDEWNYDSGANFLPARQSMANICASYIPSRIKNMYESGIDYQLYFSLEDFQGNKEHVSRNTGAFWFDPESQEYGGGGKLTYNAFKLLAGLGKNMFLLPKTNDDFIDIIATKSDDRIVILIYNYIDPDMAKNYISRNVAVLNAAERKILVSFIKSGKLEKIISCQVDASKLGVSKRLSGMFRKTQELNTHAKIFKSISRKIKINIKNIDIKENYLYQRYALDSSTNPGQEFVPLEQGEVNGQAMYTALLMVQPYSVNAIILKKKPKELAPVPVLETTQLQPAVNEVVEKVLNQTQTENTGNAGNIFKKNLKEETPVEENSNQTQSEIKANNKTEDVLINEQKAAEPFVNKTNLIQSESNNTAAN